LSKTKTLPPRSRVKSTDTWNLDSLFPNDRAWEDAFRKWESRISGYAKFRGRLAESPQKLAACLRFDTQMERAGERLGVYASLKTSEDQANSVYQRMKGRFQHVATRAAEASSFIRPEVMSIPARTMDRMLKHEALTEWRNALRRILRYRPHTLSPKEEHLLAMQAQVSQAPSQIFRQLNDADLKWPSIPNDKGELVELGHSAFSALLHSPSREVRRRAFFTYYEQYEKHRNTIAAALNGSVQRDVFHARARGYKSALEAALFPDNVPVAVYDNLVATVRDHLPVVHRYYELRRRKMKLRDIHHYDTYVPILSKIEKRHTWDMAVKVVVDSLEPLGEDYCRALRKGLTTDRWCDRYPNAGKRSGAFSSGSYDGAPYILMNYQPDVLDHVFTLAHEAGHSMHSYYSARHQPFQDYDYTIFVAEVASTFNEQLLLKHMSDRAKTRQERAYLVNHAIDEIRGTIVRQTMFAEFERVIHAQVEQGEPLTVDGLRGSYRKLLDAYFGPSFSVDKQLELECLRIPHF
jgi:oligoendopeptidase F